MGVTWPSQSLKNETKKEAKGKKINQSSNNKVEEKKKWHEFYNCHKHVIIRKIV